MLEPADDPVQAVAAAHMKYWGETDDATGLYEEEATVTIAAYNEWMARTGYIPEHLVPLLRKYGFGTAAAFLELNPRDPSPAVSPEETP